LYPGNQKQLIERKNTMARRTATIDQAEEPALTLVPQTPDQKRIEITEKLAQRYIKLHEREKIAGDLKSISNAVKELDDAIKNLVLDVEADQLTLILQNSNLDGQVFDQSNIKKLDELRDGKSASSDDE
jgi:hypothetical protein